MPHSDCRVGQGYDVHRLAAGRRLVLGGVEVPWEKGLAGHSDADVLLHAVIDAFLGAVGGGDIGQWFPDSDDRYQGADSRELLLRVLRSPQYRGWRLGNLDCTIMAEKPRLAEFIPAMGQGLAALFQTDPGRISVKATTCEKLGFIGREEGIAASAVILLFRE